MVAAVIVRVADLIAQLALICVGVVLIDQEDTTSSIRWLIGWSVLGTVYWLASVIVVAIGVHRGPEGTPGWMKAVDDNRIVGLLSTAATFVASLVGLTAVTQILWLRNDPEWGVIVEVVAVYAMLLSWALFHWGFARIYDRRYRRALRADGPPLVFPGTSSPRLIDFIYFSFTNATAFSVSDVQVTTSRMRWTVVWHTTISFFLNALIIVFAFTTIINS